MYPLLEIVTGTLFALLFLKFPFVNSVLQFDSTLIGMYALYAFYTFVLVFTFFFDFHYLKVADEILLPAILIGLIATLATPLTPNILSALFGLLIGGAFFGLQYLVSKGTWVGLGDVRVGAFMGVVLGWKLVLVALFVSYIVGSIVAIFVSIQKKQFKGVKVPFAPMLVTGTFVVIFYGETILSWYLKGLGL
jgi:prepilin signal peptidase PulO-like enzyme (type II secretory pathway)